MTPKRYGPMRILVIVVEAVLITLVVFYLSEHFGWDWHTEAGGAVVRRAAPPTPSGVRSI